MALTAWLLKDQLIAKAKSELRKNYDPDKAISIADRRAAIERLDAEILHQMRVVEAWCERCEAANIVVYRNTRTSPEAVLGIEAIAAA